MLTVSNLSKTFPGADEPILSRISFTVNAGERAGLIGPNGAGKTTLLRLILGQDAPDAGSVQLMPPSLRVGYLPQGWKRPTTGRSAMCCTRRPPRSAPPKPSLSGWRTRWRLLRMVRSIL